MKFFDEWGWTGIGGIVLMTIIVGTIVHSIKEQNDFEKDCIGKGGQVMKTLSENLVCIDSKSILSK